MICNFLKRRTERIITIFEQNKGEKLTLPASILQQYEESDVPLYAQ
ncbi:MAG: hypothetical protein U5L96_10380 [Owenweeksia sp.]|nr:hypothetical protein [Owenweeksia sp.]